MSTIDHVTRRQEECKAQYDQLTARIEAVQKDLGRALDSEQRLILEQRLQDLTAERERVAEQLALLEKHVDDILAGKIELPGLPEIEPAPGLSPYKGLQYFDVADALNFFGREALTAELVGYLRDHSFLAVVGASGSGKSSLVRAGMVPALQQGQPLADGTQPPKGSDRWLEHIITPTAKPLESLAASLTRDSESVTTTAILIDDLTKDPRSLHLYARRLLSRPDSGNRLLLVVDQFEELFTLCKDKAQRKAFVDALLAAACPAEGSPCGPTQSVVSVALALRADFYGNCAEFDNLRSALERYQRYIGAMNKEELQRTIEEPAKRGGWELEPGLVKDLLQDVGGEPGALPLLSHALLETWKRRRGRMLTLAGYAASGKVQGAIAKTADDVYNHDLTLEQQAIARNIFLRLTELGEGAPDTRRRVTLGELFTQDESTEAVRTVLQKLADARLVTTYEDEAEVAHEALIREWPALREWLEENRESLRVQRRLGEAARQWETNNRDDSYLYWGAQLMEAEEMDRAYEGNLSQLEAAFLGTSLALRNREAVEMEKQEREKLETAEALAKEQRHRAETERLRAEEQAAAAVGMRRRALVAGAIGILAMVAAIMAGLAWWQAQRQTQFAQGQKQLAEEQRANSQEQARLAKEQKTRADDRTSIAEMLLGVQSNFLAQVQSRGLSTAMLERQRDRLEQGWSVLDSGVAPKLPAPEVIGTDYADALTRLDRACEPQPCLSSQVEWETNDQTAEGLVLRSDPQAGEELLWGTAVVLTVSQGQPLIIEHPVQMELIPIPAGEFLMGSDPALDPNTYFNEGPQHTVSLPKFYISKNEVTNAQYAAFVKATGHSVPDDWENDMMPAGKEDHPVVNVPWDDGATFTEWLSEKTGRAFRLCTEAEWEKACRGTTGLGYPWADTFDVNKTNTSEGGGGTTTPVGTYSPDGDSPYGVSDMAGNVWEWVADWYTEDYYKISPADNPQGSERGIYRGLRGGASITMRCTPGARLAAASIRPFALTALACVSACPLAFKHAPARHPSRWGRKASLPANGGEG